MTIIYETKNNGKFIFSKYKENIIMYFCGNKDYSRKDLITINNMIKPYINFIGIHEIIEIIENNKLYLNGCLI